MGLSEAREDVGRHSRTQSCGSAGRGARRSAVCPRFVRLGLRVWQAEQTHRGARSIDRGGKDSGTDAIIVARLADKGECSEGKRKIGTGTLPCPILLSPVANKSRSDSRLGCPAKRSEPPIPSCCRRGGLVTSWGRSNPRKAVLPSTPGSERVPDCRLSAPTSIDQRTAGSVSLSPVRRCSTGAPSAYIDSAQWPQSFDWRRPASVPDRPRNLQPTVCSAL